MLSPLHTISSELFKHASLSSAPFDDIISNKTVVSPRGHCGTRDPIALSLKALP